MTRVATLIAGAVLCVAAVPLSTADAASPMGTYATITTRGHSVLTDGCSNVDSLILSASMTATDSTLFVSIDRSHVCGNSFQSYFHADSRTVSLPAGGLTTRASTHGLGIHASVPATVFDGSNWSDSTLRVDINIDNPSQPDPRLNGFFSATASGTITGGGASVDLAGTTWTGFPGPNQLDYAAADIIAGGAHGDIGPSPIVWPDWRRKIAFMDGPSPCDASAFPSTGNETVTVWANNDRLNGFSIHVDPSCAGGVELYFSTFDAIMPDGTLDPAKTTVIRADPGTDFFAGPSTIASLGLLGTSTEFNGGGPLPPGPDLCTGAGGTSTTDFIIRNNTISATSC
jgi:hypothetical protein